MAVTVQFVGYTRERRRGAVDGVPEHSANPASRQPLPSVASANVWAAP